MSTLMWEARAVDAQALLDWVLEHVPADVRVYGNASHVVVIDEVGRAVPEPPAGLLARPPHAWTFDRLR